MGFGWKFSSQSLQIFYFCTLYCLLVGWKFIKLEFNTLWPLRSIWQGAAPPISDQLSAVLCQVLPYSGSQATWWTDINVLSWDGAFSDLLPVTSGVPQCSILGPLLFLVNAKDMPRYIQHGFSIALFMDDSKLSALLTLKILLSLCRQTWTGNTNGALIMAQISTLPNVKSYSWPGPQPTYQLSSHNFMPVSEVSDLVVVVTGQLSWATHIQELYIFILVLLSNSFRLVGVVMSQQEPRFQADFIAKDNMAVSHKKTTLQWIMSTHNIKACRVTRSLLTKSYNRERMSLKLEHNYWK